MFYLIQEAHGANNHDDRVCLKTLAGKLPHMNQETHLDLRTTAADPRML